MNRHKKRRQACVWGLPRFTIRRLLSGAKRIYQEMLTMSNNQKILPFDGSAGQKLARVAKAALTDEDFENDSGMCQKFVRQVVQDIHSGRFDEFHRGTANASRLAWARSVYAVDPSRGSIIGDILYKAGTPRQRAGHVGIRIAGNRVAENSSVHSNGKHGAKGIRTLEEFGAVSLVVRLPKAR
jgi:hypothetical protein